MQIRHAVLECGSSFCELLMTEADHCAADKGEAVALDTPIILCRHWHKGIHRCFTWVAVRCDIPGLLLGQALCHQVLGSAIALPFDYWELF